MSSMNYYDEASGQWKKVGITVPAVTHVNGKTGDVTLTASDVGAAPEGFGLGVQFMPYIDSLDNAINNGWYYGLPVEPTYPGGFGYTPVFVVALGENITFQMGFVSTNTTDILSEGCRIYRTKVGGKWSAWEWINPPMKEGVEYRTTERYEGNPVYVKRLTTVTSIPNTETPVPTNEPKINRILRASALIGGFMTPAYNSKKVDTLFTNESCFISDVRDPYTNIKVWCGSDFGSAPLAVTIYYTKG